MDTFWLFVLVGFCAQLIDGTVGMAYGITATSILMATGTPPAVASATVHIAETVTSGFSLVSHHYFGNIDRALFRRLAPAGVIGAVAGAYVLTAVPGDVMRPVVTAYLLGMGVVIIVKAFRTFPPVEVTRHLKALGAIGGFIDAAGGGGWGPVVASTLIARGNDVRKAVGTVAATEFLVALAASATFVLAMGFLPWRIILGLALGGAIAAPIGAYACRHLPVRVMLVLVGLVVMTLSLTTLARLLL